MLDATSPGFCHSCMFSTAYGVYILTLVFLSFGNKTDISSLIEISYSLSVSRLTKEHIQVSHNAVHIQ